MEALAATFVEDGTMLLSELEIHCGPKDALVEILRFHWRVMLNCAVLTWLKPSWGAPVAAVELAPS
jgi:hypothetical protein